MALRGAQMVQGRMTQQDGAAGVGRVLVAEAAKGLLLGASSDSLRPLSL